MKSLNLAQPLILMVVGNPGAGKSFFARQFSEMFSAPVVSLDRIRFELTDKPSFSSEENDQVDRMAAYMIEELLKTKRAVIVDGGCNSKVERTKLAQAAKKYEYNAITVWVQTDLATCRTRALRRNPEKRVDDQFSPSITESMFDQQVRRFTEPTHENHVVISGKHTYNTQAKMVLRKLVASREAVAEAAHRQEVEQARQTRPDGLRRNVVIR